MIKKRDRKLLIPFEKLTEKKKDEIIAFTMEHRCDETCETFNIGKNSLDRIYVERFNPLKNKKRKNGTETINDRETQKEVSNSRD